MWVFKPFSQKERTGLEGRFIDVGSLKIHVQNAIAEGGFSCVYLARDPVNMSKQYALKHIICNDAESIELVMKEISAMKSLRGHPNIVTLSAHSIVDMGRTREALLVMEYCEKSLVQVLEGRGSGYYEEKQVLLIFRDICNAVFAMHCQSPPIAHRDLKAENLLLGSDGLWKLCDFGSTTTNHKRFDRPEEMGIEEDNIRKHTTPAYRAPEMWDLFRREVISEKVDIWALGCLLFRICYFKNAFDGESKLQVLNGNYRVPEMPKYSSFIVNLIKDMLQPSPEDRPDISQVWFRVNEMLPTNLQKSLPDRPPEMQINETREGLSRPSSKASSMPHRNPPPPPSAEVSSRNSQPSATPSVGGSGGQLGAFWSTQHAKTSVVEQNSGPKFDEPAGRSALKQDRSHLEYLNSAEKLSSTKESKDAHVTRRSMHESFPTRQPEKQSKDFEIKFFNKEHGTEKPNVSTSGNAQMFKDDTFNSFVAEFDTDKFSSEITNDKRGKEEALEAEVERLKQELRQANLEKAEITSKFEKLSSICRSQRQELQELKQTLAARTPSPNKDVSRIQASPVSRASASPPQGEKIERTNQHGKSGMSFQSSEWQAFSDNSNPQQRVSKDSTPKSVRSKNGHQVKQSAEEPSDFGTWGFETEKFTAVPATNTQASKSINQGSPAEGFGRSKINSKPTSQPAGWAGF